jgi:hypothetical protein
MIEIKRSGQKGILPIKIKRDETEIEKGRIDRKNGRIGGVLRVGRNGLKNQKRGIGIVSAQGEIVRLAQRVIARGMMMLKREKSKSGRVGGTYLMMHMLSSLTMENLSIRTNDILQPIAYSL